MSVMVSRQKIYDKLMDLPDDSLIEVERFIESLRFKHSRTRAAQTIKLGGILGRYNLKISEDDISQARREMWGNLGELNE